MLLRVVSSRPCGPGVPGRPSVPGRPGSPGSPAMPFCPGKPAGPKEDTWTELILTADAAK